MRPQPQHSPPSAPATRSFSYEAAREDETVSLVIRTARPTDHDPIVSVADEWWGRPVAAALPRLFLNNFYNTSFVAEDDVGLAGFVIGFLSPAEADQAYIHFIAIRPDLRRAGLATRLYEEFFGLTRKSGRSVVVATTPPINEQSILFHRRLGFEVIGPIDDYERPGVPYVVLRRELSS